MSKKKVACLKFDGLSSGGTEKYIQTIATIVNKDNFEVDYFFTSQKESIFNSPNMGMRHLGVDDSRKKFLLKNGVNPIEVLIGNRYNFPPYEWIDHNLFDVFEESNYDIVQIARSGYLEHPYNRIRNTKIIDSIHGFDATDQPNIMKTILLSEWQLKNWLSRGGNYKKSVIIPSIVKVPDNITDNLRESLGIPDEAFVFGFHQATNPGIFSNISLNAFAKIVDKETYFVILGGSELHRNQSKNIQNVKFIDFSSDVETIHKFLNTINVYAHSRNDGEVCSASIIEAMSHGLPIITHRGLNLGHLEQIEGCGCVHDNISDYSSEMLKLKNNKEYYNELSSLTKEKYKQKYEFNKIKSLILELYNEVEKM